MNKVSEQLNVLERKELKRLEAIIEKGMSTFFEVGSALKTILDKHLYKETHSSFEAYSKDRWGFGGRRAYQLIEAAEVRQELRTTGSQFAIAEKITNERQLRELANVPTDKIEEVLEVVSEIAGDKPPSAKQINQAVQQVIASEDQEDAPDREPGDDTDTDPYMTFEQQLAESAKNLKGIRLQITATETALKAIVKCERGVLPLPGLEKMCANSRHVLRLLDEAKLHVIANTPHGVCTKCNGKPLEMQDGCAKCGNHGWLNSAGSMAVTDKDLEHVQ